MQTAGSILFGAGGVNSPVKAKVARSIGKSKSTISRWADDPDKIPLGDLRSIVRCLDLTDRQIVEVVRGR